MQENRETSQTPGARVSRRTAGEGLGHTARMYVCEESDSGRVPRNHSNQDGKPVGGESGTARVPRVGECADKPHAWPLFICDKSRMR